MRVIAGSCVGWSTRSPGFQGGAFVAGSRVMKSREAHIRLKRFQVEEKRRQVALIEQMISEFDRTAKELNDQVLAEQERSGIHDAGHFAYPTFAKAATQRRDNLAASERALKEQLTAARVAYDEAVAELEKAEAIAERDQMQASAHKGGQEAHHAN
jgi:flagellar protein FliJ